MRPAALFLAAALLILAAGRAAAEEWTLTLDTETTEVRFTVGATLHSVEGSVAIVEGTLRFDPAGGPVIGEIVADATSADTGKPGRDEDMHRKVLESEQFRSFVLRPTELAGTVDPNGTSEIELRGVLAIHGGEHPVILPAEVTIDGSDLSGSATLEVPYVEWGMKNPSKLLLRVEKLVEVEITLAGTLSRAAEVTPD